MTTQRFGEVVELTWQGGMRFEARVGDHTLAVDSDRAGRRVADRRRWP